MNITGKLQGNKLTMNFSKNGRKFMAIINICESNEHLGSQMKRAFELADNMRRDI